MYTRFLEVLALAAFGGGFFGGYWVGHGRLKDPETIPFIQARVEGGTQCKAIVRYGFAAEKGMDVTQDSTVYLPGTYTGPPQAKRDAAQQQALLLEYYGLLLDCGFKADSDGRWIKPKKCGGP